MGEVATQTRVTKASIEGASSPADAVLMALSDGFEATLAELRQRIGVGTNFTENQLSRALRQLIASDRIARPRRGCYVLVPRDVAVASGTSIIPAQRVSDTAKPLARPLTAAPRGRRRERSPMQVESAAPAEAATIGDAAASAPAPASDDTADSADDQQLPVVAEAAVEGAITAEPLSLESFPAAPDAIVETPAEVADPGTTLEPEPEPDGGTAEVVAASTEDVALTVIAELPVAEPAVAERAVSQPASVEPAPAVTADENVLAAQEPVVPLADDHRGWYLRATFPIGWFVVSGLALMLLGSVVGGLIAVVGGVLAILVYRRSFKVGRRGLASGATNENDPSGESAQILDSVGVG